MLLKTFIRGSTNLNITGLNPTETGFTDAPIDKLTNLNPVDNPVEVNLIPLDYPSSSTVFLFSGPPTYYQAVQQQKESIKPIGLCTQFVKNIVKTQNEREELHNKNIFHTPGKVRVSLNLGRVVNGHNSLLYAYYRWLTSLMQVKLDQQESGKAISEIYSFVDNPGYENQSTDASPFRSVKQFSNLGSEYFNMPFGLCVAELDGYFDVTNVVYYQNVSIASHGSAITVDNPLIMENTQLLPVSVVAASNLAVTVTQRVDFILSDYDF